MCNREKWRNFVYYRKKYEKSTKYYVNQFCIKNPHALCYNIVLINMWIMWITYFSNEVFADIYRRLRHP